jgi:hypothetical protein
MGFWTSTALAFVLSAFAPAWQQGQPATVSSDASSAGERTAVVFHVKGATFPGRKPIFTLEGKEGTSYRTQLVRPWDLHRINPPDPEWAQEIGPFCGWREGVFWDIPVGTYTFVARSTPYHPVLRIENVKVTGRKGYGCYPAELQELVLQEQNTIAVRFKSAQGKRQSLQGWPDERVRLVRETEDGVQLHKNWLIELDQIRFAKEYVNGGFMLILSGHQPISLDGIKDGDVLSLRETPFVKFEVQPPTKWPDGWYYYFNLVPTSDQSTLANHQVLTGCRTIAGKGNIYFPVDGDYKVQWVLMPFPVITFPEADWSEDIGETVSLKATDPPQLIRLQLPTSFVKGAWDAEDWRKSSETPVIEMKAAPPLEVPPPPPAETTRPPIDHR